MAAYSYLRVSTGRQAEEGESLGAQQRKVDGYAMMHDLGTVTHFIERGVSGSIPLAERPEGGKLLAALARDDVVVTPKLDRCFRSALDALDVLATLKERGVALHMIDLGGDVCGNGISKLVFTILSAVAEAERDRIRERISDVKADQRKRGRYLGGTRPFGYAVGDDGGLVPLEVEQQIIQEMVRMRGEKMSLRAIATEMAGRGFEMSHMRVKDVIARSGR